MVCNHHTVLFCMQTKIVLAYYSIHLSISLGKAARSGIIMVLISCMIAGDVLFSSMLLNRWPRNISKWDATSPLPWIKCACARAIDSILNLEWGLGPSRIKDMNLTWILERQNKCIQMLVPALPPIPIPEYLPEIYYYYYSTVCRWDCKHL